MKELGVLIESGPGDWQVLQRRGEGVDIQLDGRYAPPQDSGSAVQALARVVREDDGSSVVPWTPCEMLSDCRWRVTLRGVPTGGLYRIESCLCVDPSLPLEWACRGDMIHHVGVGDLYVIAGQSNAAGYAKSWALDPPQLGVHVLRTCGRWDMASHPLADTTRARFEQTRESVNPGHSPWLSFAKKLQRRLGCPIGLLPVALGGSALREWDPDEGALYACMREILRTQGDAVRGVLWYQGCSDVDAARSVRYLERFSHLVERLREDVRDAGLPFLTVQLNRSECPAADGEDDGWGAVRQAQREAAQRLAHVYIMPSTDCSVSDFIHNAAAANVMLGERIADAALGLIYGRRAACLAPDLVDARIVRGELVLEFANVTGGMYLFEVDAASVPFRVVDERGRVEISGYRVEGSRIWLMLGRALSGRAVVHGAHEKSPASRPPVDLEGRLPMLSFYNVPIKRADDAGIPPDAPRQEGAEGS